MPTTRTGTANVWSRWWATRDSSSPTARCSALATASTTPTWSGSDGPALSAGQVPSTSVAWSGSPSRKPRIAWSPASPAARSGSARVPVLRPSRTMLPLRGAMARCSSVPTATVRGLGIGRRAVERHLDAGIRDRRVRERPMEAGHRCGRRVDRSGCQQDGGEERDQPRGRDDRPIGTGPVEADPPPLEQCVQRARRLRIRSRWLQRRNRADRSSTRDLRPRSPWSGTKARSGVIRTVREVPASPPQQQVRPLRASVSVSPRIEPSWQARRRRPIPP